MRNGIILQEVGQVITEILKLNSKIEEILVSKIFEVYHKVDNGKSVPRTECHIILRTAIIFGFYSKEYSNHSDNYKYFAWFSKHCKSQRFL